MTPAAHLIAGAAIQRAVKHWWGWLPLTWASHGVLDGLQFVGSLSPQIDLIVEDILWVANIVVIALMLKISRAKAFWIAALVAWLSWDWEWLAKWLFGYSPVIHHELLHWSFAFTNPSSILIEVGLLGIALSYLWWTREERH